MKLQLLKSQIDRLLEFKENEEAEVVIVTKLPYTTVGATPTVKLKSAHLGFDWEKGKFLLNTEEPLTPANLDFEEKFKTLQEKYGLVAIENRKLKTENAKLLKELNKLKNKE